MIQRKNKEEEGRKRKNKDFKIPFVPYFSPFFLVLPLFFFCTQPVFAESAARILEKMPVQHGGRIKPFQSFAREAALNIVGSARYENLSATELVWNWIARPEEWNAKPMIPVPSLLKKEFGVMLIKGRISPEILLNHRPFTEKVQAASEKRRRKDTLTLEEKKYLELYGKGILFQDVATGALPGWIAHPDDPRAGWIPLQGLSAEESKNNFINRYPRQNVEFFMSGVGNLVESWRKDPKSQEALEAAKVFSKSQQDLFGSQNVVIDQRHLSTELLYNNLHAFGWAGKLYFFAAILFLFQMVFFPSSSKGTTSLNAFREVVPFALAFFLSAFFIHLAGFVLRCIIAGRPPVTNMYESVIWVSWAAALFAVILFVIYRAPLIPMVAAIVGTFALWIAESFPALLDPSISPLVPVLRSNMWLTIHVLTITMSYGAFALAWGLGHAVILQMTFGTHSKGTSEGTTSLNVFREVVPSDRKGGGTFWSSVAPLSSLLYRALQIGVVLLASGTILGGVWANYSWGRFWGWDPKETWALIALLGYLVVLHGRFAGWLDTFSAAAASVIAFAGVVMAWYGVNYVLAAGLHSYGFGGGGAPYVVAIALADIAIILGLGMIYKRKTSQKLVCSSTRPHGHK